MSNRRGLFFGLAVAAVALLAGCNRPSPFGGAEVAPRVLLASDVWQRAAAPEDFAARLSALREGIQRLRDTTATPWVGRQDDQTGYLTELSGGRHTGDSPRAAARALLDGYATELFGAPATQVAFTTSETGTSGVTALRAEQRIGDVPVLDGALVFTVRDDALIAVRGRVFPGVNVDVEPRVRATQARRAAEQAAGGEAVAPPQLVVLPSQAAADPGTLAWQVFVSGADQEAEGTTAYFVDAITGGVVGSRPASIDEHGAFFGTPGRPAGVVAQASPVQPVQGESVDVRGTSPQGRELTAKGTRTPDGRFLLADTTTPTYDPATGGGGIFTYDAGEITSRRELPGKLASSDGPVFEDREALAAHVQARAVYDYYQQVHGRQSWDGAGAPYISSVDFPLMECNAFFSSALTPPQIAYTRPCRPGGKAENTTQVSPDTTGHEFTHGVTSSSAGLIYAGQSGALNESFSDYFGNVIGNRLKGTDNAAYSEDVCVEIPQDTGYCRTNPEGTRSVRFLLNGATFDDYLRILDPSFFTKQVLDYDQDNGGVHLNSAVWNNAVWSIRRDLARIDGVPGNESPLAAQFDDVVYATLTRYLTPTSGFLDAARDLEAAARELGVDPAVQRVITEQLQFNRICQGCAPPTAPVATALDTTPATQKTPAVAGDRAAWLEFASDSAFGGTAVQGSVGTPAGRLPGQTTIFTGFAGPDAAITAEVADPTTGRITVKRHDLVAGDSTVLADSPGVGPFMLAGSDRGATWFEGNTLSFVDAEGTITKVDPAGSLLGPGESLMSAATGGGTVALGGDKGTVIVWKPGTEPRALPQQLPASIVALAVHGDTVAASVVDPERSLLAGVFLLGSGQPQLLSSRAAPFGVAASEAGVVWPQVNGPLTGAVAREAPYPDTNLHFYSLSSNRQYTLLNQAGQQGYPAISGNRLVWQDAVLGGDDIFTATLPSGL